MKPLAFHRSIPGYVPTPLVELPELGVWVKDESDRFGLPAFKVLGASWAAKLRDQCPARPGSRADP
jgi:diaminopropionate ammonia-lyase